jgi:hypothetical protein
MFIDPQNWDFCLTEPYWETTGNLFLGKCLTRRFAVQAVTPTQK